MKGDIERMFDGSCGPGVYRTSSRAGAAAIDAEAARRGWRVFRLDGRHIASKAEFLQACAQAMGFPDHFGHNWDALVDCLRDLSWAPAEHGYLVLFEDPRHFAVMDPAGFAVALDILRDSVEGRRGSRTPLCVLLRRAGHAADCVAKLCDP